nr:P1 [Algerian watermelon mosaic virus]
MATIMFGDFLCKSFTSQPLAKKVVKKRKVPFTRTVETLVPIGCGARCGGVQSYTKTSLRRAISDGDLDRSGGCYYCGLKGLVGGREPLYITEHVQEFREEEYEDVEHVPGTRSFTYELVEKQARDAVGVCLDIAEKLLVKEKAVQQVREVVLVTDSQKQEVQQWFNKEGRILDDLSQNLSDKLKFRENRVITRNKNGLWTYRTASRRNRKRAQREESKLFMNTPVACVTSINCVSSETNEIEDIKPGRKCATSRKLVRKKPYSKIIGAAIVNNLIAAVSKIMKSDGKELQIVHKRGARIIKFTDKRAYVRVKHLEGKRCQTDLATDEQTERIFGVICKSTVKGFWKNNASIQAGDSGLVIHKNNGLTNYSRTRGDYLIVRGRHEGKIYDARTKITYTMMHKIIHY